MNAVWFLIGAMTGACVAFFLFAIFSVGSERRR